MNPTVKHLSPELRVHSGPDSLRRLGGELARLGASSAVVVCGKTMARSALLTLVRDGVGDRCAAVVTRTEAHSPRHTVEATAEELRAHGADAVVAVGGGSAVVTARAASVLLAEGGDLAALATSTDEDGNLISPRLHAPKLPQFVVPTTPNTAIVKAGSAVFDPTRSLRLALFDPATRARSVFVHPELLMSAPRGLVLASILDTLTLAVEGLLSPSGDPIADALLSHAVRLLANGLATPEACQDAAVRTDLCFAALMAGRGSDQTGAGIATVVGHAIGPTHGIDNGLAKAVVLPHVVRFNAPFAQEGIAKLAIALGLRDCQTVAETLETLFAGLDVPTRLRDLGLAHDALDEVAALGMRDWFLRGNPRPVDDAAELLEMLRSAW